MSADTPSLAEALVQVAYGQHAADMILTIQPAPTGGAVVPPHWRAEAERIARPYTDALSAWLRQHRDDIARVLADHEPDQTSYDARDLWGCACGFTTSRSGYDEYDVSRDWAEYHAHVADVVLHLVDPREAA